MLLHTSTLQRPAQPPAARSARGLFRAGPRPGLQRRQRLRLPCAARYDAAEALAEGDCGAVAPAARSATPAAEEASGGGWRSWLPFSWVSSGGSSNNGNGSFKSTVASSEPALALLDSDGMASALALVPAGLTAPQPAQLSPTLEAELAATAQQAQQRRERRAPAQPAEGPTVLVRGGAAAAAGEAAAELEAAAAAGGEEQEESNLLLPGGIPLHHPVLELLRHRKEQGSRPGRRSDSCKLGGWCSTVTWYSAVLQRDAVASLMRVLKLCSLQTQAAESFEADCRLHVALAPLLLTSLNPRFQPQAWCWRAAACAARSTAARCRYAQQPASRKLGRGLQSGRRHDGWAAGSGWTGCKALPTASAGAEPAGHAGRV